MSDLTTAGALPKVASGRSRSRSFVDHALVQLTIARFRTFWREPEALFWTFAFPLILAAGLGLAFRNRPPDILQIAAVTPEIARSLGREKQLAVQQLGPVEAAQALRNGKVALVAEPGPGGTVVYRYDDSNPEGRTARMLADAAVQRSAGRTDPVPASDQLMHETGSRYIDFLIPGLVGMTLMGNGIWSIGFPIVDMRRRNLVKRLIATPMPRHYYLLSFVLARLGLLGVEMGVLIGMAVWTFGVPLRGGLLPLAVLCILGSMSFCAFGLLLASRARTIEAVSGLMNVTMMPMWILSGVFFSSQRFPDVLQPVIRALPLTAINEALRANMLQGVGLSELAPQMGILGAWLLVCFVAALKLFRWR